MIIKCKKVINENLGGLALIPFIFVREDLVHIKSLINHEKIHIRQQLELLVIPFYIWYVIEWIFKGYRNISFEREAYQNDKNLNYLQTRKPYSFLKYLKK